MVAVSLPVADHQQAVPVLVAHVEAVQLAAGSQDVGHELVQLGSVLDQMLDHDFAVHLRNVDLTWDVSVYRVVYAVLVGKVVDWRDGRLAAERACHRLVLHVFGPGQRVRPVRNAALGVLRKR